MNNFINFLADKLLKFIENLKLQVKKTNTKITSYNDNQDAIKKMYEPIIHEKKQINNNLYTHLKSIKQKNNLVQGKVYKLQQENKDFKKKITTLQTLMINHKIN